MSPLRKTSRLWLWALLASLAASIVCAAAGWETLAQVFAATLGALLLLGLAALALRILRWFLWRVGRRLAFSYFLIGILPIPMLALLLVLGGTMLAGFFLGHLYRDAVLSLHDDLAVAAAVRLAGGDPGQVVGSRTPLAVAQYRAGRRISGDARWFPEAWPAWLHDDASALFDPGRVKERVPDFVSLADGSITLAAAAGTAERGTLAILEGDLEAQVSERADVWIGLLQPDDPAASETVRLQIGSRQFALRPRGSSPPSDKSQKFFARRARGESWLDSPAVRWGEISGPLRALTDGAVLSDHVVATLTASPRLVRRHLFSSDAEVNTGAWAAMIAVAFLLFDVYLVALVMAAAMIYGLSRAVNRLTRATAAVARGDFSVRIPVRRKDQLGALQRSFNSMGEHLTELVATSAQKEALESELEVARQLQKSLLPSDGAAAAGAFSHQLEFATHFEPSAAIGGDYFDMLPVGDDRLAVVIADVSGHGLPAGLRMAMLKAGLQLLAEDAHPPAEILRRLDALVRTAEGQRSFVTATLAYVRPESGEVELLNAGHPPTYRVGADGAVEEILLPGSPLGGLGQDYGRRHFRVAAGDFLVWLSDGLIEAVDDDGESFGYERVIDSLRAWASLAPRGAAAALRDHLLAAVRAHCAGHPAEDDRTLVVMRMRYRAEDEPAGATVEATNSPASSDARIRRT